MENRSICNSDYKKAFKSDHLNSVKHLEKINQYYCKKCNKVMPPSDKLFHLNSDQHKNKTKQQRIWCGDCGKYISDKTRQFQSEIHTLRSQNNRESYREATQNAFGNTASLHGVKVIVNEKTCNKMRVNPTGTALENLEHHINELLDKNYFLRYKYQLSFLAKFSKIGNVQGFAEEVVFQKWVKSDFNYKHMQSTFDTNHTIHNTLMQKLDDEQLEGSGFVLNGIVNGISEIYEVNDIQASSYLELPEKYKNDESIVNIKNDDQFCFLWCILVYLYPVQPTNITSSWKDQLKFEDYHINVPVPIRVYADFESINHPQIEHTWLQRCLHMTPKYYLNKFQLQ